MISRKVFWYCCDTCGKEFTSDSTEHECPSCHGEQLYRENRLQCSCGEVFILYGDVNECPNCHRLYNIFGDELAPRRQWEQDNDDDESCNA